MGVEYFVVWVCGIICVVVENWEFIFVFLLVVVCVVGDCGFGVVVGVGFFGRIGCVDIIGEEIGFVLCLL